VNPSKRIDKEIADLADWRGKTLADIRRIIHHADPAVIEEWKWMGTPVWCEPSRPGRAFQRRAGGEFATSNQILRRRQD